MDKKNPRLSRILSSISDQLDEGESQIENGRNLLESTRHDILALLDKIDGLIGPEKSPVVIPADEVKAPYQPAAFYRTSVLLENLSQEILDVLSPATCDLSDVDTIDSSLKEEDDGSFSFTLTKAHFDRPGFGAQVHSIGDWVFTVNVSGKYVSREK